MGVEKCRSRCQHSLRGVFAGLEKLRVLSVSSSPLLANLEPGVFAGLPLIENVSLDFLPLAWLSIFQSLWIPLQSRATCMITMSKFYSFSFDLIFLSWESYLLAWFSREVARSLWVQGAPVFAGSTQVDQNIFFKKEDNGTYDYPIYLCNKRNKKLYMYIKR